MSIRNSFLVTKQSISPSPVEEWQAWTWQKCVTTAVCSCHIWAKMSSGARESGSLEGATREAEAGPCTLLLILFSRKWGLRALSAEHLRGYVLKTLKSVSGWCGSVDWAPAYKPKGHRFDSQSGHLPGLQARSLIGGAWEATTHHSLLSFCLPSPLSKNK